MSSRDIMALGLLRLASMTLASPWLLGFSWNERAAISACAIALLLMAGAVAGLLGRPAIAETGALTIGAWSMVAPLLLGFAEEGAAFMAHIAAGASAMLLAAMSADWRSEGPPEIRV